MNYYTPSNRTELIRRISAFYPEKERELRRYRMNRLYAFYHQVRQRDYRIKVYQ